MTTSFCIREHLLFGQGSVLSINSSFATQQQGSRVPEFQGSRARQENDEPIPDLEIETQQALLLVATAHGLTEPIEMASQKGLGVLGQVPESSR